MKTKTNQDTKYCCGVIKTCTKVVALECKKDDSILKEESPQQGG